MRRQKSFKLFTLFAAFLRDPVLLSVGIVSFGAGYGVQEVFKVPSLPSMVQSQEGIVCQTCFTLSNQCLPLILETIQKAQKTIRIQTYSFTSEEIADTLIKAHERGVKIVVIADKNPKTNQHSHLEKLVHQGIEIFFDTDLPISHSKVMIVDETTVVTGSYHFTNVEEQHNAENIIVIKDKDIARPYIQNFNERLAASSR